MGSPLAYTQLLDARGKKIPTQLRPRERLPDSQRCVCMPRCRHRCVTTQSWTRGPPGRARTPEPGLSISRLPWISGTMFPVGLSLTRPSFLRTGHCPLHRDLLAYRVDGNFPVAGNSHQPLRGAAQKRESAPSHPTAPPSVPAAVLALQGLFLLSLPAGASPKGSVERTERVSPRV